jgi:hypothetical protein
MVKTSFCDRSDCSENCSDYLHPRASTVCYVTYARLFRCNRIVLGRTRRYHSQRDFKSFASADFATRADWDLKSQSREYCVRCDP